MWLSVINLTSYDLIVIFSPLNSDLLMFLLQIISSTQPPLSPSTQIICSYQPFPPLLLSQVIYLSLHHSPHTLYTVIVKFNQIFTLWQMRMRSLSRDIHYAQKTRLRSRCAYIIIVSLSPDDVAQCAMSPSARIREYAEKVSGVPDRIRGYTTVTRVEYGLING